MTKEELKKYAKELEEKLKTVSGVEGLQILKELSNIRRSIAAL